jgi:glycosyltransferase involved in cell wall biosynthesis
MMDSITFVSPRYPPYIGGVETHVAELTTRASARFRRVSVVTTDPLGDLPATQILGDALTVFRVRSFAPGENYHFPISTNLVKILRASRSRILHLHSIHDVPGPLAAIAEGNSGSSIVFTPHFHGKFSSSLGRLFFEATRPMLNRIMDRVNCIICVSKFEARIMGDAFPGSAQKIRVIPNGVDSELLSGYSWSPPTTPRILFVGRLEKYKNVDKVLAAFAILRENHPSIRLTIVGRGPVREELLSLSEHLRLGQSVEWLEGLTKAELYGLYESSTMFVLPSYLEAYGIVVAEAVAVGTPAIVANSTALSEFVRAGLATPVEPPVETEKLVDAMSLVLDDPKSYSLRGRTSEMIQSWDDIAMKTFDTYQSLL